MERDLTERISTWIIGSSLIKKVSTTIDGLLQRCFQIPALRSVKIFLNGTWVGHPLHPLLTDIPIGAWTLTVVLDLVGLLCRQPQLGLAAAITAGIGVLGAAGAIAAGLMDWMDVDPPEKAVGAFHAILNGSATILFMASLVMRCGRHWQPGWGVFAVALAGYVLVLCGGYLGGILVFHMGVMINRNAYRSGPDDFTPAMAVGDLPDGRLTRLAIDDQPILLVRFEGKIHALGAVCSHYGAPLNEGTIVGRTIECPWHSSRFSLEDGNVVQGPACAAIPAYDCKIVNDQVQVKIRR